MNSNKEKTRKLTTTAMLGAITVLLGLTPLGFMPLGALSLTTMHIPVIIAAIMEGPMVGGIVGLIFGLTSLFMAITRPTPISFVFYNPLVSILPRILIGVVAAYVYKWLKNKKNKSIKTVSFAIVIGLICFLINNFVKAIKTNSGKLNMFLDILFLAVAVFLIFYMTKQNEGYASIVASFMGALTNTILFLGMIYIFYAEKYVTQLGFPADSARSVIFGVILTNGVPEAIMASVIITPIVKALQKRRR